MSGLLTDNRNAQIDWVNPVNWLHPLNRGLVHWNLVVPGANSGRSWVDLANKRRGILTSLNVLDAWRGASRQGSWGDLRTDGTGFVDTLAGDLGSTAVPVNLLSDFTFSFWIKTSDSSFGGIIGCKGSNGSSSPGYAFFYDDGFGVGIPYFRCSDGTNQITKTMPAINDGIWHHIVATRRVGVEFSFYLDGKINGATVSDTVTGSIKTTTQPFRIGLQTGAIDAQFDDIRCQNALLSGDEVKRLYESSFQYHPGLLNRINYAAHAPLNSIPSVGNALSRGRYLRPLSL